MQCHLDGAIYMYNMKRRMLEEYAIDIYYGHWHVYLQWQHLHRMYIRCLIRRWRRLSHRYVYQLFDEWLQWMMLMEYDSLDDVMITHDDEYMGGKWSTLAQQARVWAMWIGLQFVLARYGGTGPLGGVLDVRIDQLIGDLLDEEDENYCKY